MKKTDLNLELIDSLTNESIEAIEKHNESLIKHSGASITIANVNADSVNVHVKNINGQRTSKVELLNTTYKVISENIPKKYRVLITL